MNKVNLANIGIDICRCEELIVSTQKRKGAGQPGDPVRMVLQIFSTDGTLMAENDPVPTYPLHIVLDFAAYCWETIKDKGEVVLITENDLVDWLKKYRPNYILQL